MWYLVCVLALGLVPVIGCTDGGDDGGMGGGIGGIGGAAGSGAEGGMGGGGFGGEGGRGGAPDGDYPCTEQGIRDAITEGGGPHTFACDGPKTVTTVAEIVIDNDVSLDGRSELTIDGGQDHPVLYVERDITAELQRISVSGGSADGADRAGGITSSGDLTLRGCQVEHNSGDFTGGILNRGTLTIRDSAVTMNTADGPSFFSNGGIMNERGTLTMANVIVSRNTATADDFVAVGGVMNDNGDVRMEACSIADNTGDFVGAIICQGGTLEMTNSTISGNVATADDGFSGDGGIVNSGAMTMTNCTISGNAVADVMLLPTRGAISNGGTLEMTNCTVTGNAAYGTDGIENSGTLILMNSIVDGDCTGSVSSNGHNIESPGNTCGLNHASDQYDVSSEVLNLGPLVDNGGPTLTHALLTQPQNSAAIDVIPDTHCIHPQGGALLTEDQRGVVRPQGADCDVGAFELEQP